MRIILKNLGVRGEGWGGDIHPMTDEGEITDGGTLLWV